MSLKTLKSREFKIGVVVFTAVLVTFFGLNYLKGINLFNPANYYYATFETLEGMVVSNSVTIKGYKVGQVNEIFYDFTKEKPFVVQIRVTNDIKLPKGTELVVYDDGLMGGKAIDIKLGSSSEWCVAGDTLPSSYASGLLDAIGGLAPKLEATLLKVDSLLTSLNTVVSSPEIKNSLASFENITADLEITSKNLKNTVSNDVPKLMKNVNDIADDVKVVTGNLKGLDFAKTMSGVDSTVNNLNAVTAKLKSKDNTIGLLLNDSSLHKHINQTIMSADSLLVDLKANPKRYVHFSLFGGKEKKKKEETN